MMTTTRIRRIRDDDRLALVALWERSVRATHHFLAEADIAFYQPLVVELLTGDGLELWVLADEADLPIGFLGLSAHAIEALFLEPAWRGKGCGRLLVEHAQALLGSTLRVDVNEQNVDACGFYEAVGFVVTGRSPEDDMGRPYPLLHMRRDRIDWRSRGI